MGVGSRLRRVLTGLIIIAVITTSEGERTA
jgi:hypothetical protein